MLKNMRPVVHAAMAALIAAPAAVPGQESAEHEIVRLEREMTDWQAGSDRKEPMPHRRLFADDWSGVDSRGTRFNKEQGLLLVERGTFTAFVVDNLHATVYGDAAVATGRVTFSGTFAGAQYTDRRSVFTNMWIRKDGRWQQVASQFTSVMTP
jgi:ketosteroid isomerase-like protein